MEAIYVAQPAVRRMVRLAIKRARRMFDAYPDMDDESLEADMLGEVARAFYNPTKSQPHTFAYRVAWCRLRDVSRKRTKESEHLAKAFAREGVRSSSVEPDEAQEGTDAEMAETARMFYVRAKDIFEGSGTPIRDKRLGRIYPDRAQRSALLLLQQKMGWTCREAAKALSGRPAVLIAIGVTQPPSRSFFSRASAFVTQFKKNLPLRQTAIAPAA